MNRDLFVAILSPLIGASDAELLREAEGLIFWRKRELRAQLVQLYKPGQAIQYLAKDGHTRKEGIIDHLNKYSVTLRHPNQITGYWTEVLPIERVLGPSTGNSNANTPE